MLVGGRIVGESHSPLLATAITRRDGKWQIHGRLAQSDLTGREIRLEPLTGLVRLDRSSYRGWLRLVAVDEGKFIVVNHTDLESYLTGVLARELFPRWHATTYRALAVVARTYAIKGMTTTGKARQWDVTNTQASQVYGGVAAETSKAIAAVRGTHGVVAAYGPVGSEKIFLTQYSSTCGGRVNPAVALRKALDIPPLRGGQVCEDCRNSSRYRWPAVAVPKAEIARALAARYRQAKGMQSVTTIRVVSATEWGRPIWVDVVDTAGKKLRFRAEDIRLALLRSGVPQAKSLYSMNCTINDAGDDIVFENGRGFGHGVGLCQYGAEAKARAGKSAEQIVLFYYPQARLFRAY